MTITTPNWDDESWISSDDYIDYTVRLLIEELSVHSESRLLDVGCGRGKISAALALQTDLSLPIDAIDVSDSILEAPTTDKVNFLQTDVLTFLRSKKDRLYDGVIMKQMFHLLPIEIRQDVLIEVNASLKKDGRAVILAMPSCSSLPMFKKGAEIFSQEVFPLDSVLALAKQCGFKTHVSAFNYEVNICKRDYFDLLINRFMSNLRSLSDQDIQTGIEELDGIYSDEWLNFFDRLDVIHLIPDRAAI